MNETSRYDVIIIGTGAGRRHARPPRSRRPGKRILLLERGDYVPREKDNWSTARRQRRGQVQHEGGLARQGRQAAPSAHQLLRRRQHQVLRRGALPAAPARTSASCGTTAASRRRGRSPTTTSSRTTPQAEHLYHVHGERGEDPTEPPASAPYPHPAGQPRAAHPAAAATTSRGSGSGRSTCRSGVMLDERDPQHEPLHPLRHLRRVSRAWSTPSRTPRSSASIRRSQHPNVTLLTGAYVARLETSAVGPRGHAGRSSSATARRETLLGRHRRRRRAARSTRRRCCCARPTTGIRSGLANGSDVVGPPLHGPRQLGADGALASARTRPSSRRRSALNDFYFGSPRVGVSRWATSPSSASSTASRSRPARRPSRRAGRST